MLIAEKEKKVTKKVAKKAKKKPAAKRGNINNNEPIPKDRVTLHEAARLANVGYDTVRRFVLRGDIPHKKHGKHHAATKSILKTAVPTIRKMVDEYRKKYNIMSPSERAKRLGTGKARKASKPKRLPPVKIAKARPPKKAVAKATKKAGEKSITKTTEESTPQTLSP